MIMHRATARVAIACCRSTATLLPAVPCAAARRAHPASGAALQLLGGFGCSDASHHKLARSGTVPRLLHTTPTGWGPAGSQAEAGGSAQELDSGSGSGGGDSTHFGFQTVATQQKQALVGEVFSRVASQYDLMNDVMSGGLHRWWKDEFVRRLGPFAAGPGTRVLDVAGGTGDTAFRIADLLCSQGVGPDEVDGITVCDINADMLAEGKRRYETGSYSSRMQHLWPRLDFVQGDAQSLPFEDDSMDVYTITFGIRNVTNIEAALSEAFRVLKPGGRFMCLEFSHVPNAGLQAAYDLYSFQVIPQLGQLIAGDRDSYQYLVESIRRFPDQQAFAQLIHAAGFRCVTYENFTGGIVAAHSGFKPQLPAPAAQG